MLYPGDPGFEYLDPEEKELVEDIETNVDSWKALEGQALAEMTDKLREAAGNTLADLGTKTERMNIRMTKADMIALKRVALREGLPYQSLVTSILHKFTNGRLVDIEEARKALQK
jgi:predicted DNA binding CopG/RHH family protein